jgi:hypothetical protein
MNKSREENNAYWTKHKNAWEGSGLSQSSYSKQEGLCIRTFNYHVRKLNNQSTKQEFKFIEAPLGILGKRVEKEERVSLRVELPNGVAIVLELSAALPLSQVIAVAGALRC